MLAWNSCTFLEPAFLSKTVYVWCLWCFLHYPYLKRKKTNWILRLLNRTCGTRIQQWAAKGRFAEWASRIVLHWTRRRGHLLNPALACVDPESKLLLSLGTWGKRFLWPKRTWHDLPNYRPRTGSPRAPFACNLGNDGLRDRVLTTVSDAPAVSCLSSHTRYFPTCSCTWS